MKKITLLAFVIMGGMVFSQVGINTVSPKSTFDITAKTTDGSKPEGLIAPRLTGDQIKAGDGLYGADQKGSILYVTEPVGTSSPKTININAEGYYFFDGNVWQKIFINNIYNNNGTLVSNRTVNMADKTINFTSAATTGTSHFQVDGTTLNVDAVNHRMGIGTAAPAAKLDITSSTAGGIKITDGTQKEGRLLVADDNGLATWRDTSSPVIIPSTAGPVTSIATGMTYTGASAVVTIEGYYIISPRIIFDKAPSSCSSYLAYNLSNSLTYSVAASVFGQDIHMAAAYGGFDFIYTSNVAKLKPGTYYLFSRYANGGSAGSACTSYNTRGTLNDNAFTLTLLK
ncbi:hypothetical protein [Chryseobacterium sp. MYb328]|uniref:hypothetical protein n=1 Tax=Chryseobacterium sp. MYb328 TaxID=2745231 RepID=UPI0030B003BF